MTKQSNSSGDETKFIEQPTCCQTTDRYEVGYGKPPKSTQFKKGRSGNLKGRPKKKLSAKQCFHEVFARKVLATVDGKRQCIDGKQALFLQLRAKTSAGDLKAIGLYFDFCKLYGTSDPSEVNPQLEALFDSIKAGPVDTP